LAIGWSLDFALDGLSLLAQQVIFGPLALTAIVLAILDKLLWLGAVFVALPSANLLLGMIPLILFTIGVMIFLRTQPTVPNLPRLRASLPVVEDHKTFGRSGHIKSSAPCRLASELIKLCFT